MILTDAGGVGSASGSGFVGVLMGLCAILGFIAGSIGWFLGIKEVMDYLEFVLQLGLLSAALMGVRKFSGVLASKKGTSTVSTESEKG